MKLFLGFFFSLVFWITNVRPEKEQKGFMIAVHNNCTQELGVPIGTRPWQLTNTTDPKDQEIVKKMKCYDSCVLQKTGGMKDGKFNLAHFKECIDKHHPNMDDAKKEEIYKQKEACAKKADEEAKDTCEKASMFNKCSMPKRMMRRKQSKTEES